MHYEGATTYQAQAQEDDDGGFGDDFDDFEQGEGDEEFGGFDDGLEQTQEEESQTNKQLGVHQSLLSMSPDFVSRTRSWIIYGFADGDVHNLNLEPKLIRRNLANTGL